MWKRHFVVILLFHGCIGILSESLPSPPSGYQSLQTYYQYILQLRNHAPEIISPLFTYGRSYENRLLQGICIGYYCSLSTIPGELITAMHHGREPMGAITTVHFIKELVEEYLLSNPSIIALLHTRRLYIILSINPDAYEYNIQHTNNNQVMARKNRHDECTRHRSYADVGVDLNRNYDFAWDLDNEGSSPQPCAEDFRGTRAFSEPETLAIQTLLTTYQPQTEEGVILDSIAPLYINTTLAINWHSYARFINLPYAVSSKPLPPDNIYTGLLSLAEGMAKVSGYGFGHPWTGGLYTCNGEASDWMIANRNIYAFSPEIGPQIDYEPFQAGMWPSNDLIPQILHDALPLLYYSYKVTNSHLLIPQLKVTVSAPLDTTHICSNKNENKEYICGKRTLSFDIHNKGIWKNKGNIVITSMHYTALSIPLNYYTGIGSNKNSITIDKLKNYIYYSDDNANEQEQIHRQCKHNYFTTQINTKDNNNNQLRNQRQLEDSKKKITEPFISNSIIKEIKSLLHDYTYKNSTSIIQNKKWDMSNTLYNLQQKYDSSTLSSSSLFKNRQLDDTNVSPFSYQSIPFIHGYQGISTIDIPEFHSISETMIALPIDIPFEQPTAGSSFPDTNILSTDNHNYWGYVSISDENICTIYGIQAPSSLTTSSLAIIEEVYHGLSSCLPCAAFRQIPFDSDAYLPSSSSPSPLPSTVPSSIPTTTSVSDTSKQPSSNTKEPWKTITFPGSEYNTDNVNSNNNHPQYDIWPWSTSLSLQSISLQIILVILGFFGIISMVLVRTGIIQFRFLNRTSSRGSSSTRSLSAASAIAEMDRVTVINNRS